MIVDWSPSKRWAMRFASLITLAPGLVAGCQSYERAPLNLVEQQKALDARLLDIEPVSAFADRIRAAGGHVPDRFDPSDGLTPAEGELLALFYNADLRLARLEAGVALANFENAGLWEDPEFGFNGAEILSPSAPFEFGLTLSLTVPVSGRLEIERDRAGAVYDVELRRIVEAEWRLRAAVRRAWAQWTAAVEQMRMLREVVRQVERIGSITDRLEAAGELNRVEARLFRVELAERLAALAEAKYRTRRARIDLLGLMGLSPNVAIDLVPAFPIDEPPGADGAVERLIEANAQLAVRRAEYEVAEETLRLEIRKQFPDITIGSEYGSEDDDHRLLLGFSIPVPILNANRGGIAEARAKRELARAAAETTFEILAQELASAQAAHDAACSQRVSFESTIVPLLAEQSAELERIVELGDVDTFLLLETVTRTYDAKRRLLELRLAESSAAITISHLLGPDGSREPAPIADHTAKRGTP